MRSFAEAGEEARFAAELPLKLIIADGSLVLCDMPDPVAGAASSTTLYIEHPALAGCLRLAFQTVWESAATAEDAGVRAAVRGRAGSGEPGASAGET